MSVAPEELPLIHNSLVFALSAVAGLAAGLVLVKRLEVIGDRLRITPALLGLVVALAADAPEITASLTALLHHQPAVSTGVVLGSNGFNLAALLGLGAITAGGASWARPVMVLEGTTALWLVLMAVLAVTHVLSPTAGLAGALVVFGPYLVLAGLRPDRRRRLWLPGPIRRWLCLAVAEEESDLGLGREVPASSSRDGPVALVAVAAVIAASEVMERSASAIGRHLDLSAAVIGGVVLAAVTSLPNAVAGVYLARRGRSAALLSEAFNSNALNILAGLLIPSVIFGAGAVTSAGTLTAAWALGLTAVVVAAGLVLGRFTPVAGTALIGLYLAFAVILFWT